MYRALSKARFLVVVCGFCACTTSKSEPPETSERADPKSSTTSAAPEVTPVRAAPVPKPNPRAEGWDKFRLIDEVPLCIFASHDTRGDADFLKDVHKQKLRANSSVVFGAFARGCVSEACDAVPTLECRVEAGEEPRTLVVHSRYSYEHKQGTVCTADCRSITAGCETQALAPGTYTVKYGTHTFRLRIPSVLRDPCFDVD